MVSLFNKHVSIVQSFILYHIGVNNFTNINTLMNILMSFSLVLPIICSIYLVYCTELLLTWCKLFFSSFFSRKSVAHKNHRSAFSEILKSAPHPCHSQSHGDLFILMFDVKISWSSWPLSAWFYPLHSCLVSGWFNNCINEHVNRSSS